MAGEVVAEHPPGVVAHWAVGNPGHPGQVVPVIRAEFDRGNVAVLAGHPDIGLAAGVRSVA